MCAGFVVQCQQDTLITLFRWHGTERKVLDLNARLKRLLKLAIAPSILLVLFLVGWLPAIPFAIFFAFTLRIVVPLAWTDLSHMLQTPRYLPSSQTDSSLPVDDQPVVADQEAEHGPTPGLAPLTLAAPIEDEEEDEQDDSLDNLAQPHEDRPGTPVSGLLVQYQYVDQ